MSSEVTSSSIRRYGSLWLLLTALAGCLGQQQGARGAQEYKSEVLQNLVDEAYAQFRSDESGKNADYIPYLATVPSQLFGMCIVTADGRVFTAGDVNYSFSIQSCSKVFTLCQTLQESGDEEVYK